MMTDEMKETRITDIQYKKIYNHFELIKKTGLRKFGKAKNAFDDGMRGEDRVCRGEEADNGRPRGGGPMGGGRMRGRRRITGNEKSQIHAVPYRERVETWKLKPINSRNPTPELIIKDKKEREKLNKD